jgi:hypothetical protein
VGGQTDIRAVGKAGRRTGGRRQAGRLSVGRQEGRHAGMAEGEGWRRACWQVVMRAGGWPSDCMRAGGHVGRLAGWRAGGQAPTHTHHCHDYFT